MRAVAADTPALSDRGQGQSLLYDAFISCGHDDRAAAYGVQRGLHHKQQDALAGRADRRAGGGKLLGAVVAGWQGVTSLICLGAMSPPVGACRAVSACGRAAGCLDGGLVGRGQIGAATVDPCEARAGSVMVIAQGLVLRRVGRGLVAEMGCAVTQQRLVSACGGVFIGCEGCW